MFEDAWFAGFAAGEGCFSMRRVPTGYAVSFVMTLRADEMPLLDRLRRAFGGTIGMSIDRRASDPSATWAITHRGELPRLIAYFDRYPLRAKKGRDYAIWRNAALAYIRAGSKAEELPALREELTAARLFDQDAAEQVSSRYIPARRVSGTA